MARLLIVSDSEAMGVLLREVFRGHPQIELVGKASTIEEATAIAAAQVPDLVVIASGVVLREDAVPLADQVYRANQNAVVIVVAEFLPEPTREALLNVCAIPLATNFIDLPRQLEDLIPDLRPSEQRASQRCDCQKASTMPGSPAN